MTQLLNGENAAIKAAQALSEHIYTYKPITNPSTNIWDKTTGQTVLTQDLASRLHSRTHASALLSADGLIAAIPHLYKLAAEKTGVVLHVSAENSQQSFADFSNVMAVRQSGLTLLSSSTVQEAYDLAVIAHVVAIKTSTPILHFFDSKRIANEYATVEQVDASILTQLVSAEDLERFKSIEPAQPNQTAYLQYKQKQQEGESQVDVYAAVQEAMVQFASLTGRQYAPLEYSGHAEAERAIIAMGAGATVVEKSVDAVRNKDKDAKVGVLKARLYRPWSDTDFLAALPSTIQRVAVLEPCQDFTSTWNPLFLDVAAAYQTAEDNDVEIISGQYGVNSNDFTPSQVAAVLKELTKSDFQRKFAVSDLAIEEELEVVSAKTEEFVVVGNEALAIQYGEAAVAAGKYAQVYTIQVKNEAVSHVRVSSVAGSLLPSLIANGKTVRLEKTDAGFSVVPDASAADKLTGESAPAAAPVAATSVAVETPYIKMLDQVFQDRLEIANAVNSASIWSRDEQNPNAAAPEFGYGKIVNKVQERARFIDGVEALVKGNKIEGEAYKALSQWLLTVKSDKSNAKAVEKAAQAVLATVTDEYVVKNKDLLISKSNWLIGSDSWAYDLGQSGVHHVISQGENVNMLIVETLPYSSEIAREQRKKDVGLYAMNFGSVYVASVAVYSSYTGVLHALMEADAYNGPSIVLAYLPQPTDQLDPVFTLKETKVSIDNGSWPLYRWNPALELEGKEAFTLDSQRIKKDLEKFLERENHFSQIVAQNPDLSTLLVSSLETVSIILKNMEVVILFINNSI
jgi:pyruvate/2-oxoacid:ferredoxin oxidoreductase alpha subunit/pyruvate/2-oxoacid:ferredoxin oxidoreductase beta subunit